MILQRYIGISVAKGWLLVLLVLGAVFGLISFTQELDHTEVNYNALQVARYTLLTLPNQLVGLAPVIALLGSIVAGLFGRQVGRCPAFVGTRQHQ